MKKIPCLIAILSFFLLTGCTKNYKSVTEYESAIKAIKKPSLTIEASQKLGTVELYYKTQAKNDKWKTQTSMNNGNSYMTTVLYDGEEILTYSQGSPYAIKNPFMETLSDADEDTKISAINMQNPTSPLLNWQNGFGVVGLGLANDTSEFINNKDNRNGFDCRLIKLGDNEEACISDKYGIAVYHKVKTEKGELEINLIKIDTTNLSESEFELPQGVKKMDFEKMLETLSDQIESVKNMY